MNFEICKKCMGYSLKNKIHGYTHSYDKKNQTVYVNFNMINRMHRAVTALVCCDDEIYQLLKNNRMDIKCLKNHKVLECTETNGGSQFGWKQCPYQMEHLIDDWNKNE